MRISWLERRFWISSEERSAIAGGLSSLWRIKYILLLSGDIWVGNCRLRGYMGIISLLLALCLFVCLYTEYLSAG